MGKERAGAGNESTVQPLYHRDSLRAGRSTCSVYTMETSGLIQIDR